MSFGACCFHDGVYLSGLILLNKLILLIFFLIVNHTNYFYNLGKLIGYYNKSQPIPKPIYLNNRIILGKNPLDTSFYHFINANQVNLFFIYFF